MSELRVALVAEGPTDAIVIESALKALLSPRRFVLTQLQPEATRPDLETGWGGVLKWCLEFVSRGQSSLEDDPTLSGFDLFVLHVDADVSGDNYEDISNEIAQVARDRRWPTMPCNVPCPPPTGRVDAMRCRLLAWAGLTAPGPKTVLCVPSMAIDAWLAAAIFDQNHSVFVNIECKSVHLETLPIAERVRKKKKEYQNHSKEITETWDVVRSRCSQADRFSSDVLAVVS